MNRPNAAPGDELQQADVNQRLEQAVDEAIATCDGDARAAVRSLLLVNEYLEAEIAEMFMAVCHGYARGRWRETIEDDGDTPASDHSSTGSSS